MVLTDDDCTNGFISRMLTIRNEKQLQCTTKKKEGRII